MTAVALLSRRIKVTSAPRRPLSETVSTILRALPAFGIPVIIIGGILRGFFTLTEASVVAAIYGLVLGLFIDGDLKWRELPEIFWTSARQTAQVLFIIAVASAFGWIAFPVSIDCARHVSKRMRARVGAPIPPPPPNGVFALVQADQGSEATRHYGRSWTESSVLSHKP